MNTAIFQDASRAVDFLKPYLTMDFLLKLLGGLFVIIILWILYKLAMKTVSRIPAEKTTPQRMMLIRKFIKYLYYVVLVLFVLSLFGIRLSAVWGAAGIAGVAIGFAAQTSVSNLISGVFVLTEGALKVGDTIIVDEITGVVDTVSLLSVRVHTHDNQMVRIPNSTILNSNLINNNYFPCRRMTISVNVSYDTDLEKALAVLSQVPSRCTHILCDPEPKVWLNGFGASGIEFVVAGFFCPADFLDAKNELFIEIKKGLDAAGISIPYDKLDVYVKENGSV